MISVGVKLPWSTLSSWQNVMVASFRSLRPYCCGRNNLNLSNETLLRRLSANLSQGHSSPLLQVKKLPSGSLQQRFYHASRNQEERTKSTMLYITAGVCLVVGFSYAAVPMYRIFCQTTGYGGEVVRHDGSGVEQMTKIKDRPITIRFNADTSSNIQWNFKPQQIEIILTPGETALAFYTATNPTDQPIVGISTYNVIPFEAGQYFNKIQCFCFEEQRLNPHEQVDMPVFFYIDPEFAEDPRMELVDQIILSYTFFEAKEGMKLAIPQYHR